MVGRSTGMALMRTFREEVGGAVVSEAARIVQAGGVIAMPTDSVYALGAYAFNEAAVRRVRSIKGRDEGKPILVLIADRSQLEGLAARIPAGAAVLMDRFWPGPLTIVLPASPRVPAALTAGTGTVGVRLPDQPLLVKLLRITGPLTGTSANRSGKPPAWTAQEVEQSLGADVDLILDGGPASVTRPSTVVETGETVRVLREGPVERAAIKTVLAQHGLELA